MHRARLLSKTGCHRCRKRRVKCGEEKPKCVNCTRLHLECTWLQQSQQPSELNTVEDTLARLPRVPVLDCYQDGLLTNGYESFRDDKHFQAVQDVSKFIQFFLGAEHRPIARHPICLTLSLQFEEVRASVLAFSFMTMASQNSQHEIQAWQWYQRAITGLRTRIANSPCIDRPDVVMMTMVLFLCFIEIYAKSRPEAATTHICQLAHMAKSSQLLTGTTVPGSVNVWMRTILELMQRLISSLVLFDARTHTLFTGDQIQAMMTRLRSRMLESPHNTGLLIHVVHAMLGLLAIRVAKITHGDVETKEGKVELRDVYRELNKAEEYIRDSNWTNTSRDVRACHGLPVLILGLRLYLLAQSKPNICSGSTEIRFLIIHATRHYCDHGHSFPTLIDISPFVRVRVDSNLSSIWVFLVILCATHQLHEFEFFASSLFDRFTGLDQDFNAKVRKLVDYIRDRKERNPICGLVKGQICDSRHDGLDLLPMLPHYFKSTSSDMELHTVKWPPPASHCGLDS